MFKRAFLPFLLWLLIAAVLVMADAHLRLLTNTRIFFRVSVEGHPIQSDYAARLSSIPVLSGVRVLPGWRIFRVAVNDAEPIQRNFFVWYGSNNLGDFDLNAHKGS